eukprot:CAMPEP_0117668554 /NCGR_PEP_ID=MMETSP0804-20121206/11616_1 /TAXON_ID=1074897 /ORGANISM="Tetraselmis astigmatica, Strain CCMP880" /LENGTH=98 /DNA_ID=CAMNT_0005476463 /DNA_START=281 /DNA_END=576 /DNA_ORIENTATION=+
MRFHLSLPSSYVPSISPTHVCAGRLQPEHRLIPPFLLALVPGSSCPPYDLTPTYKNINNKFSVRYFLNLVLVDEEDRRYFKQQEIQLCRVRAAAAQQA